MKNQDELKTKIKELEKEIKEYITTENNNDKTKTFLKNPKNPSIAIAYNICADILAGIITAFILNGLYCKFFTKNNLVFAFLLIGCVMAGLYGTIKNLMKQYYKK